MGHVLWILFGPGAWGTGGNLIAAALLGGLGVVFRKRIAAWWKLHASNGFGDELEALKKHLTGQVTASHTALLKSVDRRHQEVLDRVDNQHEAVKQHITEQVKTAVTPAPPPPPPAPRARKPAGGGGM